MTPEERKLYNIQGCQEAIQRVENMKNGLILIYQQHMAGNPAFPRGLLERAKLVMEQFFESRGIVLDYKKPKENKLVS